MTAWSSPWSVTLRAMSRLKPSPRVFLPKPTVEWIFVSGPTGVPALDHVQTAVIELVPGVAYEVNEFLSIGVTFRLGVGLFAIDATAKPADGEFSAFGVGAGFGLGVMMKPSDTVRVGGSWTLAADTRIGTAASS